MRMVRRGWDSGEGQGEGQGEEVLNITQLICEDSTHSCLISCISLVVLQEQNVGEIGAIQSEWGRVTAIHIVVTQYMWKHVLNSNCLQYTISFTSTTV